VATRPPVLEGDPVLTVPVPSGHEGESTRKVGTMVVTMARLPRHTQTRPDHKTAGQRHFSSSHRRPENRPEGHGKEKVYGSIA
jgi:hypothetical protein